MKSIEYCLALDWCASSFDKEISKNLKFPLQEFFSNSEVVERFTIAAHKIDWGQVISRDFFRDVTGLAETLVFEDSIIKNARQ